MRASMSQWISNRIEHSNRTAYTYRQDHYAKGRETMRGLIRQGDVLLIPTTKAPKNATVVARDKGRVILAYGETTGHAHAITHPDATLVTAEQAGELRMWLKIEDAAQSDWPVYESRPTGGTVIRDQEGRFIPKACWHPETKNVLVGYAPAPGATLVHDEHDTLLIPPGTYRRVIQREYAPEGLRNVQD